MLRLFCRKIKRETIKQGFTLVELSLSIAFIATLSVAVTLVITNAISAYHRGITLNQINTVGMDLVDDMRTTVQSSSALSIKNNCSIYSDDSTRQKCENDGGKKLVVVKRHSNVKVGNKNIDDVPVFGAFCVGNYSYIWNSGYFFDENSTVGVQKASFSWGNGEKIQNFRLLKVKDETRAICASVLKSEGGEQYSTNVISNAFTANYDLKEDPIELLGENNNLALYDLGSAVPAENDANNSLFYSASFILGTLRGGVNVMATGEFCATPESYSSVEDFNYCAVNKFNFAARTLGG